MAAQGASSSSSSSKLWKYDVFLSFRGEDTRNGFTGHLHTALEEKGYKTFIDEDDLERGEEIKPELLQAIEESKISIIVFSKRYADSSWCLDELVKIMECRSKLGQHVLPIFYHAETSDIRKQEGSLAPMFQKHEADISKEEDDNKREAKRKRVEQWKEALTKAANLSGYDLKNTVDGFTPFTVVVKAHDFRLQIAAKARDERLRLEVDLLPYLLGIESVHQDLM